MGSRIFRAVLVFVVGICFGAIFVSRGIAPTIESALSTSSAAVVAASEQAPAAGTYPVTKVVDGDTLAVGMNGKSVTLRLIGLDTPETVDPRKTVQCFGKEASDKAKEMLAGQAVRVEQDPSQGAYDKYGRLLAYVYLPDGTLFNELMIAEGYGHEYTYNLPYQYQKEFKEAEAAAREGKKGLWADGACSGHAPSASIRSAFSPAKQYDCSRNAYNCSSFSSQAEAQYVFELCGGDGNDVHQLDSDKDGKVCESLP